jgi:hypothetical protein
MDCAPLDAQFIRLLLLTPTLTQYKVMSCNEISILYHMVLPMMFLIPYLFLNESVYCLTLTRDLTDAYEATNLFFCRKH